MRWNLGSTNTSWVPVCRTKLTLKRSVTADELPATREEKCKLAAVNDAGCSSCSDRRPILHVPVLPAPSRQTVEACVGSTDNESVSSLRLEMASHVGPHV
eukprot:3858926-Rhodomonas_salina.1